MDNDQRKKRKRTYRPYPQLLSVRSITVCLSFFVFLLFVSSDRLIIRKGYFRPVIGASTLSMFPSFMTRDHSFDGVSRSLPLVVEGRVLQPDHLLLIVSNKIVLSEDLVCVYYKMLNVSADVMSDQLVLKPVMSVDEYRQYKSIVKCELPLVNYSAAVDLWWRGDVVGGDLLSRDNQTLVPLWDSVVYEAVLDWNSVVVFAKGLNLRPHREADESKFRCHFGLNNFGKDEGIVFTTKAIAVAQEVVRCVLPRSIKYNPHKAEGIRVTISRVGDVPLPTVATVHNIRFNKQKGKKMMYKYDLCACTMLWNQASFLREWITYHAWLGVERWFIYDNGSNDELREVIDELNLKNYNISRHAWPWVKTQEAGFSHCSVRGKHECKWLGLFDVDEFFYFPDYRVQGMPGSNSLRALVMNYTNSQTYAEIRTSCHSYGPSGLSSPPSRGVTVGYTCRLKAPERHKSIVRPELLHASLLNEVHHFRLREGYRYLDVPETIAVVNHYKYQVWDTFKAKFFRRVSTYVANWQDDQNQGSRDRAPGLGTMAVEPPNWRTSFCEVWDTGLKNFVMANFADATTSSLPWERSLM